MKGENFYGLTLIWKHVHGYVDIPMPNFFEVTLKQFLILNAKRKNSSLHMNRQSQFMTKIDNLLS